MLKTSLTIMLAALCGAALAAPAPAAVAPAKQQLVQQVLQLWQIDTIGQAMLQAPVGDAVQQARAMLQGRAAPERRDAALADVLGEAKKFMDEATPTVRASAQKLIPGTVAPLLAERFSEDELRQMVAILESPVKRKFEAMLPEMQKLLGERVAADTRADIDPKLQGLKERIGLRLRAAVAP
ncbi:DUF2059 domain-containing protein [Janthinobacterium fluminis]|uniref:DUF2059 domain-containing protein n=1 Tax=Janthinobacterium fluminis TaxID=2987524 RepID=A0ABT5JX69_9BURK|nr:DUF2059 domain-containing protein [Janthinobacterium fluminis]MDC8757340.1 DUF2059 domain-containing protein [Janthinobacterium fluminis]